ncbi:carbohydrate ABC transporter permease [Senegalia massiliensis]|uniref:Sugar ABC transporter permease n=1 Tax=Senegalia massiliensis TaxID=1720316 RepID=A0A845QXR9_9CLOT|nr:sugar ABC transporter permease [Senegalia massiliensis]NBI06296.1 sugar ABC transporter permease [Senegalia massiliensis]
MGEKLNHIRKFKNITFLLPSLIGFFTLYIIPFVIGIRISFSETTFNSNFAGFKNYIYVFKSEAFQLAIKNTSIFMLIGIPLIIIISFLLALAIFELKVNPIIKLFIILPIAIPSASISAFFEKSFGIYGLNLLDSKYAMIVVIIMFLWKNTGYNLIIYLAGFTQIDKSAIEAAKIDGANYWGLLKYIIIPLLTPTTAIVGIITIINSFKVFKEIYILQGKYPNPNLYMLQHYLTNKFNSIEYHHLTSAAYIFTLMILAFIFLFVFLDKRYSKKVGDN